jgi:MFS family permease
VTNVGSWMQVIATGWLVLQLSNSAGDLGISAALMGIPILVFALVGGVIADRMNRYWLATGAQFLLIVPDAALALLVGTNTVTVEHVFIYSLLNGIINGMANPARQALVPSLVPKKDLMSAMALNGILWQGAAILGPMLAGLVLAAWGMGANFYINVVSDLICVAVLLPIKTRPPKIQQITSPWQNVAEGLRYAWHDDMVRRLLLTVASISLLGRAYVALMPIFARDIFQSGPEGLGILMTMPAVGTIIAGFGLAVIGHGLDLWRWFMVAGIGVAVTMVAFSAIPSMGPSLPILVLAGLALTSSATFSQTLIQQTVAESFRGRVMGLYMACSVAAWRVAALPFGFVAERWGVREAVAGGAVLLLLILAPNAIRRTAAPAIRQVSSA